MKGASAGRGTDPVRLTAAELAVFDVPGFYERMPRLRRQVTPLLIRLGAYLAPRLEQALGREIYPRAARHLRRTARAPEETWVAFGPSPRAYKPYAHFRVVVGAAGVDTVVFVEPYADVKPQFAEALEARAASLAAHVADHPEIRSYDLRDADGVSLQGPTLDAAALRNLAAMMRRSLRQGAVFGIPLDAARVLPKTAAQQADLLVRCLSLLDPFYACGLDPAPATS